MDKAIIGGIGGYVVGKINNSPYAVMIYNIRNEYETFKKIVSTLKNDSFEIKTAQNIMEKEFKKNIKAYLCLSKTNIKDLTHGIKNENIDDNLKNKIIEIIDNLIKKQENKSDTKDSVNLN